MKFTSSINSISATAVPGDKNGLQMKSCPKLSKREIEILKLVTDECTAAEIAKKLFLSLDTVETHKRNIIKKLDARNTIGAVIKAMRLGLIK